MGISPDAVTNNANSKMLMIERIVEDRTIPTPERMRRISALCDDFRNAVAGSTADPCRADESTDYVRCTRCGKRVSNVARIAGIHGLVVRAWVECPECVGKPMDVERPAIDPDALAAVQAQIADALSVDPDNALLVEEQEPLIVSWPLEVTHPQPPGVPSRMLVTVTDADA